MHATKPHKIFLKSNCTNNVKENIFYKEKYDRIKHFFCVCVVLSNGVEVGTYNVCISFSKRSK